VTSSPPTREDGAVPGAYSGEVGSGYADPAEPPSWEDDAAAGDSSWDDTDTLPTMTAGDRGMPGPLPGGDAGLAAAAAGEDVQSSGGAPADDRTDTFSAAPLAEPIRGFRLLLPTDRMETFPVVARGEADETQEEA
jgi:hypothetical protein